MSQVCPLCGKTKPEEVLFCDDCSRKIHSEYEVDIPKETGSTSKTTQPGRKKRIATPLLFVFMIGLLVGAFFVYNATIRKTNLDRSGWDAALKENTVKGYLAYMNAYPRGIHFDQAQEELRKLKSVEASMWEKMKETDNITELRDFLNQYPGSPYAPLVKTRLDSLTWIGTLRTNTGEAYSDYIMLSESGGIRGDYIAEAQKRYALLFGTQSMDPAILDSIRTTIDGFFISLTSLDHNGMIRYLAPMVQRFFDSGTASRERITGELLVTGARTEGATLKFIPDLQSIWYEMTNSNHYKVNVPLQKTYQKNGSIEQVYGYIVHMELDPLLQIVSIFETKPYPEAP
ncbi:tetratricopeptide repeat protein [Proteiniphilum sp. UBA5384]|uniref:tetratricopeptide repeat protein n=1 Tax=Proteiniphilum sp. UBA5384 TaxID=1947279 RepID=UPI0025DAC536|nr:hypothetical protein [Proteiniphilum sp. UBA5384]